MIVGAGLEEDAQHRSPCRVCSASCAGMKNGAPPGGPAERAVEPDEMIDAIPVEERGHPARALPDPRVVRRRDGVPPVHVGRPQSCPVSLNASGGTPSETSSRNSRWRAQTSALSAPTTNGRSPMTVTPCAARPGRAACHCDLGDPLPVLLPQHLAPQAATRLVERGRIAIAQRRGPVAPRRLPGRLDHRA